MAEDYALVPDGIENAGLVFVSQARYAPLPDGKGWAKRPRQEFWTDPRSNDASVSIRDHGFVYAGGVFEGINFYTINGKRGVLFLEEHIDRMYRGARQLRIEMPYAREELARLMLKTIEKSGLGDGYLRPIVTRGQGVALGITAKCTDPSLFIYVCPPPPLFSKEAYERGLNVTIAPNTRISSSGMNITELKWLAYTINTETKQAALDKKFDDALMFVRMKVADVTDAEGEPVELVMRYLSEASAANVFVVKDGVITTPSLETNCLSGVTRNAVIELAKRRGYEVREGLISRRELLEADEIFETGTAAGVIAVANIDGKKIGNGREGEITGKLREAYFKEVIPGNLTLVPAAQKKVPVGR